MICLRVPRTCGELLCGPPVLQLVGRFCAARGELFRVRVGQLTLASQHARARAVRATAAVHLRTTRMQVAIVRALQNGG